LPESWRKDGKTSNMNTIKEATKQSSWSQVKHSFFSEFHNWFYNYTKQELQDDDIYISYVIGQDKPTLSYVMHFFKQVNKVFLRNHQMNFLVSKTTPKAVEAIEGNFELYLDKEKFLNFFQYEIPSFINRNKLKGINKETLLACLQWINLKKEELENEKAAQSLVREVQQAFRHTIESNIHPPIIVHESDELAAKLMFTFQAIFELADDKHNRYFNLKQDQMAVLLSHFSPWSKKPYSSIIDYMAKTPSKYEISQNSKELKELKAALKKYLTGESLG
jgi:hypothetical protein